MTDGDGDIYITVGEAMLEDCGLVCSDIRGVHRVYDSGDNILMGVI